MKISLENNLLRAVIILALFLGISAYLNFQSEMIPDPDCFYHIKHALLYRTNGIWDSSFPWIQYSTINEYSSDLWYGFHVLLIPFTFSADLAVGIKLASFFVTFLVLGSLYWIFKNLRIKSAALWPLVFLFSSPVIISRATMARPHNLSLVLTGLIFSSFYSGPAWIIFIFSFLLAWIHSSVFWIPLIITGPIILFKFLNNKDIGINRIIALTTGLAAGLLARPNPIGNLKLIYIQIVDLYLEKNKALAETIGGELNSPGWTEIQEKALFTLILFFASILYSGWIIYKRETFSTRLKIYLLSSLTLSVFFILMYSTAKRAIDLLCLFVIIFAGLIISHLLDKFSATDKLKNIKICLIFAGAIGLLYYFHMPSDYKELGFFPNKFKEPATWLKENTEKESIVFHLSWDQFPSLFYWNDHNYYIQGMDPIFLYKHNPDLYWKIYYMWRKDMAGLTCGKEICSEKDIEPVYNVLKNDFKASYVFVRRLSETRLIEYLESDKEHFEKVYELGHSVIFKILSEKTRPVKG